MSSNSENELRMPSFFPRAPEECKGPAQKFFDCFTAAAVKKSPEDTEAGVVGLKACQSELSYYENCMTKGAVAKKTKSKLFRVQDEYRVLGTKQEE